MGYEAQAPISNSCVWCTVKNLAVVETTTPTPGPLVVQDGRPHFGPAPQGLRSGRQPAYPTSCTAALLALGILFAGYIAGYMVSIYAT